MKLPLSQSDRGAFQKCAFAYHLGRELGLTKIRPKRCIESGRLIHKGFEDGLKANFYRPSTGLSSWIDEGLLGIEKLAVEGQATPESRYESLEIFERSFTNLGVHTGKWRTAVYPDGVPSIERRLISTSEGLPGTPDWIAIDSAGRMWLVDFKTRETITPLGRDRYQTQGPLYIALARAAGMPVVGEQIYQIRRKVMSTPDLLKPKKDGLKVMSRAQVWCDWEHYKQCLIKEGIDPEEYEDMKEKLRNFESERMDAYFWSDKKIQSVLDDFDSVREQIELGKRPRTENQMTCPMCFYREWCEADAAGEDPTSLIGSVFEYKGTTEEFSLEVDSGVEN